MNPCDQSTSPNTPTELGLVLIHPYTVPDATADTSGKGVKPPLLPDVSPPGACFRESCYDPLPSYLQPDFRPGDQTP